MIKIYETRLAGFDEMKEELRKMHAVEADNRELRGIVDHFRYQFLPENKVTRGVDAVTFEMCMKDQATSTAEHVDNLPMVYSGEQEVNSTFTSKTGMDESYQVGQIVFTGGSAH